MLEEATGDTNFVVVAVDNQNDRAVYAGPVYSYYEFTSPTRLTDEVWRARISGGQPGPHPAWSQIWRGHPLSRALDPRHH